MKSLNITKDAMKFIEQLPSKQYRQVASKVFDLLRNPFPQDTKQVKGSNYYRVDIGEYRIVYHLEGDCVKVAVIGKRNDSEVYRK